MAICSDPSITFLNKFGYNVIKLPRTGIEPMDVVGKDKTTELLGKISSVWSTTAAAPQPGPPQPAVNVQGQKTDKLALSVGLKVLANALQAFGASVPSLDAVYSQARNVQFTFTNVTSTAVSPLEAGNYLASGDLNTQNPAVSHYFLDHAAHAYLIFDVLKSNSIAVEATNEHGVGVNVDVPQIQGLVGANVGVSTSGSSQSALTFTGPAAVSFGFKAFEISFVNGKWTLVGAQASGGLAFGAAVAGGGPAGLSNLQPVMLASVGLVNM